MFGDKEEGMIHSYYSATLPRAGDKLWIGDNHMRRVENVILNAEKPPYLKEVYKEETVNIQVGMNLLGK